MGKKSRMKKMRKMGIDSSESAPERSTMERLGDSLEESSARLAEQDRRIMSILGVESEEEMDLTDEKHGRILEYLKENISPPCTMTGIQDFRWEEFYVLGPGSRKEYEELKRKYPSYTDHFELLRFHEEIDDMEGILVHVRRISDRREFDLPLADLESVDKKSGNYVLLDDYAYWFVNYR
jgi:hypothetical protein